MPKSQKDRLVRAVVCHEGYAEPNELVILGSPPFGVRCPVGAFSRKWVMTGKVAMVEYDKFVQAAVARAQELGYKHVDELWIARQIKESAEHTGDHPVGTLLEVG